MAYFEEEDYKKPLSLKIWAKMLPFLKPHWKQITVIIILMLICAGIDVVMPLFQRFVVDNYILQGNADTLPLFGVVYLFTLLAQVAMVILFSRFAMYVEMSIGRDLKQTTFVHLQKLSFSYYNITPVGYMMARVMSDTNRIGGMVAWGLVDFFWAIAYVVGVFVSMLLLNAQLALVVMTVIPFIALITVFFQNKILHLNRKIRKINSTMTGAFNEGITGAVTSKTLVIEEKNHNEFRTITQDMYHTTMRSILLNAVYIPAILLFSAIATAFVITNGGNLVISGNLSFGTMSAFTIYAITIFEPIQQIARILSDFVSTQANIERVSGLLEKQPDIVDSPEVVAKYGDTFTPKKENWEPLVGEIEFRDVSFRYADSSDFILEHFNLKIPAGTTIAIVGETGAGKSTLVNLACRFFEPTTGQILIDGVDYRERSQLWLHSNLGYVLQNPHLFSGTVRENIRYGKLDATDAEIERAAELVSADAVIKRMEKGYESDVGEGGDRLSTGEKQLISFARAVLAEPRIFVLDEATSSIDTGTEQLIQNAIVNLLENRTSFLIAHRLSTIRKADIILVVKNGKIIERGTHQELLNQNGYYFMLYSKQFETEAAEKI